MSGSVPVQLTVFSAAFRHQRGASLIEFSIVALSVILVSLFTLQLGLIYHAKTTLNYAVFEAARTGAVNSGSISAMRDELGMRLAPLEGGDGSKNKALLAIGRSMAKINDPLNTKLVVLNPTKAAFRDWAIRDPATGKRFIPVNHLRHQAYEVGTHSGLSLRDANILKLQVTHGFNLHVPLVGKLMANAMRWIDTGNAAFYLRDKWPLQAVATVRMQSNSLESEILSSAVEGGVSGGVAQNPDNGDAEDEADAADNTVAANDADAENDATVDEPAEGVSGGALPGCDEHYALANASGHSPTTVRESSVLMSTSEFRQVLAQGAALEVSVF